MKTPFSNYKAISKQIKEKEMEKRIKIEKNGKRKK